ncbi:MAG: hypothetical protein CMI63_01120 [Parvularcula sp.]|nr:hypothetical protein [Parvularcula sp.]
MTFTKNGKVGNGVALIFALVTNLFCLNQVAHIVITLKVWMKKFFSAHAPKVVARITTPSTKYNG